MTRPTAFAPPPARLSVIIPTWNEESTLGPTLERLRPESVSEVIVVDGGSHDATRTIARSHGAKWLEVARGRGCQMNRGAAAATGDLLLFLHADTLVPNDFHKHIAEVLARPGVSAGAFRLGIDAPGRSLRMIERVVYYRSRFLQMPYGDQAIFLTADMFHRVGGFRDWPILEDYALVRRLKRMGRVKIASSSVLTSARRWMDYGIWRTTLCNQACLVAHFFGASPTRIARWHNGMRTARPRKSNLSASRI